MILKKRKMRALIASGLRAVLPAFVFTVCEVSATVNDTVTARAGKKIITITFDKQGGFYGTDFVTVSYTDRLLPAITPPVHSVYKFAGYYTSNPGLIEGERGITTRKGIRWCMGPCHKYDIYAILLP